LGIGVGGMKWLDWLRVSLSDSPHYEAARGRWPDGSFRPQLWDDGDSLYQQLRDLRLTKERKRCLYQSADHMGEQ
jgi:hypothetical protein